MAGDSTKGWKADKEVKRSVNTHVICLIPSYNTPSGRRRWKQKEITKIIDFGWEGPD